MDKRNRKKKTVDDTVCEIHKFSGYAVLSNCFVRSTNLGCPAIGLLGRVMDLPPSWFFTKAGLIALCPDGETAIDSALNDLKEWGYLEIEVKMPNENPTGKIQTIYKFYEYSAKDTSIPQYDYELETFTVDNAVLNRVKKVGNFTMISSKLLRNKEIPNKLLGFLLKVLSLPDYWHFSMSGLKAMSAYDNLFNAGYARAKADWLVGMNGSRLFSVRYGGKLNIGRVQTPTLAMIVQRDAEVNGFIKQKYYTADLNCGEFVLSSARIDDENAADKLVSACDGSTVTISSVKREVKTDKAPKLYDLTTLQREANKAFGYTAQQTLDYTQSLYEGKLVTYPRTDSQFLSDDMAQTALDVAKLCDTYFGFGISHTPDISKVINNAKVSGHHAIIPTSGIATADLSSLPSGEKNVLTLIATKVICATAPAHKYEAVKLTGICNGTEFTATGRTVLEMGWKAYAKQSDKKNEEKSLPAVSEGKTFMVTASKGEHFTSPPKPYTEDTLLSAMERAGNEDYDEDTEKKGLGTPATRAATIEALVKNGYVERVGKQFRATDKGKELVTVVPDEVKSAKLTAEWESKLQQIEHGSLPEAVFMSGITQFITEMCGKYGSVDKSVSLSDGGYEPIGKCPKCGAEVVKGKFGFYCKGKCGMNIAKVYGVELSDAQVKGLLDGKSTSYTSKAKRRSSALRS